MSRQNRNPNLVQSNALLDSTLDSSLLLLRVELSREALQIMEETALRCQEIRQRTTGFLGTHGEFALVSVEDQRIHTSQRPLRERVR